MFSNKPGERRKKRVIYGVMAFVFPSKGYV